MTDEEFENLIFSELEVYNLGRGDVLLKENKPPKIYTLVLEGKVLEMKFNQANSVQDFVLTAGIAGISNAKNIPTTFRGSVIIAED